MTDEKITLSEAIFTTRSTRHFKPDRGLDGSLILLAVVVLPFERVVYAMCVVLIES